MRRVAICLFFAVSLLSAGSTPLSAGHPVTVLLEFDHSHGDSPVVALQRELQRILADSDISVNVQMMDNLPQNPQFDTLVVFKMKGECSMNAKPVMSPMANGLVLASTYEVDGEMLPFADVQCDRVRGSLQQVFGAGDLHAHQNDLGVALARVMAHEMYHMLADCKEHTRAGVTKESLSGWELSRGKLTFSEGAKSALDGRFSTGP